MIYGRRIYFLHLALVWAVAGGLSFQSAGPAGFERNGHATVRLELVPAAPKVAAGDKRHVYRFVSLPWEAQGSSGTSRLSPHFPRIPCRGIPPSSVLACLNSAGQKATYLSVTVPVYCLPKTSPYQ